LCVLIQLFWLVVLEDGCLPLDTYYNYSSLVNMLE